MRAQENLKVLEYHFVTHFIEYPVQREHEAEVPPKQQKRRREQEIHNLPIEERINCIEDVMEFELLPPPAHFKVIDGKVRCTVCNSKGWKTCDRWSSNGKMTVSWAKLKFKVKRHLVFSKHIKMASYFKKYKVEHDNITQFKSEF